MITIQSLQVKYSNKEVIKDLDLDIPKHKFTSIIGPNGCGKSTLIKAIVGLVKHQGNILIEGKRNTQYKRKEFAQKVATLMQVQVIPYGVTVKELVYHGRYPHKKLFSTNKESEEHIVLEAMNSAQIMHLKDRMVATLSGGERQRVWLAMALAQEPDILILDEPTNHLDLKYKHDILKLVSKLNKEKNITVICVMHDIQLASKFSDNIIILKDGELIIEGVPKNCFTKEIMHKVYDVKATIQYHTDNQLTMLIDN